MKKRILRKVKAILFLVCIAILVIGCADAASDDSGSDSKKGGETAPYAGDELLGYWDALPYGAFDPANTGSYIKFNSDGTGEYGNDATRMLSSNSRPKITFIKPLSNSIKILSYSDNAYYPTLNTEYTYQISTDPALVGLGPAVTGTFLLIGSNSAYFKE